MQSSPDLLVFPFKFRSHKSVFTIKLKDNSVADPEFPVGGGVGLVGGMDSRGGYFS